MWDDDTAEVIYMAWYDPINSDGAVTFFATEPCQDTSWPFFVGPDFYNYDDFIKFFPNDNLDSVMVSKGYSITIYSDDNL